RGLQLCLSSVRHQATARRNRAVRDAARPERGPGTREERVAANPGLVRQPPACAGKAALARAPPPASQVTSEFLAELYTVLHRLDRVHMRIEQTVMRHQIVALGILAELAALVEGILHEGLDVPVAEGSTEREIDRGERGGLPREDARRLETECRGALMSQCDLRETPVVPHVKGITGGPVEFDLWRHRELCAGRRIDEVRRTG